MAIVCILGVLIITNGLTPVVDGLYISGIIEGMPAEDAGLLVEDVFINVNDTPITNLQDFTDVLANKNPGDFVEVTVARGKMWEESTPKPK